MIKTQNLTENFLPNIYINDKIKQALILQLVSNEQLNMLLLGDPSTGKTTILKEMTKFKEKASYFSSTIFSHILTPEKVLIKEGLEKTDLLCIDDIDNCTATDGTALKDILQSGISILAAADPKFGRFDPYDFIPNQIDLTPRIVCSFDLIFPLKGQVKRKTEKWLIYSSRKRRCSCPRKSRKLCKAI